MLIRVWEKWKTPLMLAAVWLLFESSISYFATCNSDHDPNYCSLFHGPVIATSVYFWMRLVDFLREHEHELVAAFAIILALSTIGLWLSTKVLWQVTRVTAEHIPRVERAYLFGGPTSIKMSLPNRETTFKFAIDNAGKTPAILKEVQVIFSPTGPSGKPDYSKDIYPTDLVIYGGVTGQLLPFDASVSWVMPFYAYGFFAYEDIFKDRHVSRFCARIIPSMGKFEIAGGPAWNDWD